MISKTLYSIKWVKQYALNRFVCVLLTVIVSASLIGALNVSMSAEISTPSYVIGELNDADYVYVGLTNHSDYDGTDFYQQVDWGYFFSKKSVDDGLSGKIDALGIKRLSGRKYTSSSLIEQCELIEGREAQSPTEVVLSKNTAERYDLSVGSVIYFFSPDCEREYTVSGICSDFYGMYEIDTVSNCGLILLCEKDEMLSSTFVHFFSNGNDNTYYEIYVKDNDIERLTESVGYAENEAYIFTVIFVVIVVFLLNFKISKYVLRLKHEHCGRKHICVFLITVIGAMLLLSCAPAMTIVLVSDSLSDIALRVLCFEFLTVLFVLFTVFACLFLRRKNG